MSITSMARVAMVAVLSLFAGAALLLVPLERADADEPAVAITEAPALNWGFKATWRNYAQEPLVSDGAAIVEPAGGAFYDLEWAFDAGSYDPVTGTTHLEYQGTARWLGHKASSDGVSMPPGWSGEPDPYLLDVTLSDPQVTISRDESAVTAVVSSRDLTTWQVTDYGRVPVVNLDPIGVTPTISAGSTSWSNLPAAVTGPGSAAMAGFYRVGQIVDSVSFSYTGPGGAPDFSEHWDTPGAAVLRQVDNELFYEGEEVVSFQPLWVDRKNLIVHSSRSVELTPTTFAREISAFDLKTMKPIGEPIQLPGFQTLERAFAGAYDSNENRVIYRLPGEPGLKNWLRFDLETKEYESGTFADPQMGESSFFGPTGSPHLAWDPIRNRGYRVQRIVPPGIGANDFDNHQWQLLAFQEGPGGIWSKKTFPLPGFPAGQNRTGYAVNNADSPTLATASDGSLIQLAGFRNGLAVTEKIPAAYRIVFNEADDAVDIQPLPTPEVLNTVVSGGVFNRVQTASNGHVLFSRNGDGILVQCEIGAGGAVTCDPGVSVSAHVDPPAYDEYRYAIDPADGIVWFAGLISQKLAAFKGGEFLGAQFFKERNPRGGPILAGGNGFVYAQTNDGSPGESVGSKTWGFGKFERLGFVPTVTGQPAGNAVSLGIGESSEQVSFSSAATGDPAPQRQWQVKAPGALKFTDLAGETGPTLSVDATRNSDGAEYRAIYSNAAGKIASDPATLAVDYAPLVHQDPVNLTVSDGEQAEFAVLSDGDPAPVVTWQRRVGGFWAAIDPADDNFELDGQRLALPETNLEQSGALFRVKVSNPLGTVFSKAAKLTVEPRLDVPPEGIDLENVGFQWTGSAEMQKVPFFGDSNFFSAGVSDGTQASYDSVAENAAAFQVSSTGTEALATWASKAAHTSSGGKQLIRLYGGKARIEPDGETTVQWDASWTVNFYGGLVPFTLADPELSIDPDGDGTLTAEMSGCESSQADPDECAPFTPLPGVTVATFSGVELDPEGEVSIQPHYAGVEAEVPVPFIPQNRTAAGWGAWPQPFVDFQLKTGLSSHWYSSGGSFDPYKAPDPFTVDFAGVEPPAEPEAEEPEPETKPDPETKADPPAKEQPKQTATVPAPGELAGISGASGRQGLGRGGLAVVATLACPPDGFCAVIAPRKVKLRIAGKRHWAKVIAPRTLEGGDSGAVKVKLSRPLLAELGRKRAKGRLVLNLRSQSEAVREVVALRLERGARKQGAGPTGVGVKSAPVSPAPPALARPATAVDVGGVELTWHPRDSWVRYASSGVAPGDGILASNGATGIDSTASPCPDRPSSSDAQLPYSASFTPKASWYDPASGKAAIYGQGSVSFRWAAHKIDLTASDPEIEIGGADSKAIFRFSGSGGTAYPDQRASLLSLDIGTGPTVTNGGKTFAYNLARGTLTADGVSVFAGFYTPPDNDEFGCVSVEFTTP